MLFSKLSPYTPTSLVSDANSSFRTKYKPFSQLIGGRVYTTFNTAISDFDFLKIVLYNNDYLKIPPVETFLGLYDSTLPSMSDEEKKCLGALFGNLFRFIFGYTDVKKKQYSNFTVSSAKYFII